jgi:D-glutamate cyclase
MSDPDPSLHPLPFQQIDRVLTGDGFVDPSVSDVIQCLQDALSEPIPLSLHIANSLRQLSGKQVFLFTGFVVPKLYPKGENDGPLGTLALARALDRCGLIPTIWVDPQLQDTAMWLAAELGIELPIRPIELDVLRRISPPPAAAIAIEKPGQSANGVMHTFDGIAIEGGSIAIDKLFLEWQAAETTTIGIGDRGNEVGFGALRETVLQLSPSSSICRCGCDGGVVSSTSAKLFLPAAVSNWGAYGIAAALAILEGNETLLLLPSEEERLLHVAAVRGCVDGVHRRGGFGVDGLAGQTSIDVVQKLQEIATTEIRG